MTVGKRLSDEKIWLVMLCNITEYLAKLTSQKEQFNLYPDRIETQNKTAINQIVGKGKYTMNE